MRVFAPYTTQGLWALSFGADSALAHDLAEGVAIVALHYRVPPHRAARLLAEALVERASETGALSDARHAREACGRAAALEALRHIE